MKTRKQLTASFAQGYNMLCYQAGAYMMVGISLPTTFPSHRQDCTHTTFDIEKVLTFLQCFSDSRFGFDARWPRKTSFSDNHSPSRHNTLPKQLHWHQESTAGGQIAALPSTLKEQQHIQTLLWIESCPLNQRLQNHCVWMDFKRLSLRCATRGVKMVVEEKAEEKLTMYMSQPWSNAGCGSGDSSRREPGGPMKAMKAQDCPEKQETEANWLGGWEREWSSA